MIIHSGLIIQTCTCNIIITKQTLNQNNKEGRSHIKYKSQLVACVVSGQPLNDTMKLLSITALVIAISLYQVQGK